MNRACICQIHDTVVTDDPYTYVKAANLALEFSKSTEKVVSSEHGKEFLKGLFHSFLTLNLYTEAALLAWGNRKFNPEPEEVQRIWGALRKYNFNLFIGASGLGKTLTPIVFWLLDWCEWPEGTNTKIIGPTAGHAGANAWSTLLDFHQTSIIELPGKPGAEYITLFPNNKQAAIGLVAIPQGDDGKGRLQGFHPLQVPVPHPKFGSQTRVRAKVDEGEKVPPGLWPGIDNMRSSANEQGSVKMSSSTNPEDKETPFGQRAEPKDGWDSLNIDSSREWNSKLGYHVTRLDAKYSRNVVEKREVFPGMQTYQGYANLMSQGTTSARFFTFGRGWYPEQTAEYRIFSGNIIKEAIGEVIWQGLPFNIASFDGAFVEGGDRPILTTGRYGLAIGFKHQDGRVETFYPRWMILVEQQFEIQKNDDVIEMGDNIISILTDLDVKAEWFISDNTGNALGINSYIRRVYGDILTINYAEKATDLKILDEILQLANELYDGIVTEMAFVTAEWMKFGYLKIAQGMPSDELIAELTGVKYRRPGLKARRESKLDYKSRTGGVSFDLFDSFTQLTQLCRMRGREHPKMLPQPPQQRRETIDRRWNWEPPESEIEEGDEGAKYIPLD